VADLRRGDPGAGAPGKKKKKLISYAFLLENFVIAPTKKKKKKKIIINFVFKKNVESGLEG
jgi:hypothetical protein